MTVLHALREYFAGEAPPRPRVRAREQLRPGFADLLAYSASVGDGVIALKDDHGHPCGPLLAGFRYVGPDLESASADELEHVRHQVNAAFGLLDTGWMVHFEAIRRVVEVHWLAELGIAQALWVLEVERLGPFLVEGDRRGRSLFALANREINLRLTEVYAGLPPYAMGRFGETTSRADEVV